MSTDDEDIPDYARIMDLARRWHYAEVRSISDEAIRECLAECADSSARERREWLTVWIQQTCDGHQHVIYTGQAALLLAASDNEHAYAEEMGDDAAGDTSARAYFALVADVWEHVDARSDEWEVDPEDPDDDDPDDNPDEGCDFQPWGESRCGRSVTNVGLDGEGVIVASNHHPRRGDLVIPEVPTVRWCPRRSRYPACQRLDSRPRCARKAVRWRGRG